ncbi:aminodeoxychorismate lyase apoprotein [Nitrosococcus oceani ATCC 19707]|uniref:Aminodeoxychorismate lyase n=2 Tax=Nitrosococcus oceani TaxID=1229 RepID=Q3JAL2_NITOC|nr:aminodeoxychorismate lyase [Nitrosococcus oceani]ABA58134.1 aminodeoxychorismate lyase apoprotein [Nitrosococcus oceani ATCC 19707]EDZ68450.1 aminotransferase, class IV superfamily [Nitrosococcus oceani AFC27]KFI19465.1 4-amino-4-deoxychorismate lyase [Nitrosococcus oceani C-27]
MILVNGKVASSIEVADRGLQYGDGLFETIAIRDERAILYLSHLKRLEDGCRRLSIPLIARRILDEEIFKLCQGVSRGVLKIVVTRGSGGRGYQPPSQPQPTRILSLHPWPNYPSIFMEYGITLRVCRTSLGYNPCLAGIKHLNRLEQVLARSEWENPMIPEGLMLDSQGHVVEGTMSNLFIVQNGLLETPDLSGCGVAGVMREFILKQAFNSGLKTIVRPLILADLRSAEEIFMCNSLIGIWPVRRVGETQYPLGPLTQHLQHLIQIQLLHSN